MALTQETCNSLLEEINEALSGDPSDALSRCVMILEKYFEPWFGSAEEIEGIVDYILRGIEEDNYELRLLLLPAY